MLAALERRHPDYVVIFPAWFPNLAADPRFRRVYTLPIPGNITMGGDEIVVYDDAVDARRNVSALRKVYQEICPARGKGM